MKRFKFAWLLVLPWVIVNDTTWPIKYICERVAIPDDVDGFKTTDQEYCLDVAAALNEAHERRAGNGMTCEQRLDAIEDKEWIEKSNKDLEELKRLRRLGSGK